MEWKAATFTELMRCVRLDTPVGDDRSACRADRILELDPRVKSLSKCIRSSAISTATILADKVVGHIFRIKNGLIKRFDIRGQ